MFHQVFHFGLIEEDDI